MNGEACGMLMMVLLVLVYLATPMVAGHGLLPMAFVLMPGQLVTWGAAAGWIGIAVAGIGLFWRSILPAAAAQLVAAALLFGSWYVTVSRFMVANAQAEKSMALETMLPVSIPFQICTWVVLWRGASSLSRPKVNSTNAE